MEKFLQHLDVWAWIYPRRPSAYDGAHFTARGPACDAILLCLDILEDEGPPTRRSIPLRKLRPEDEQKITGGMKYRCYTRLRIELCPQSAELEDIQVIPDNNTLVFRATPDAIHHFREGVLDVKSGIGDYAIGPSRKHNPAHGDPPLNLWFWPCFGHIAPVP